MIIIINIKAKIDNIQQYSKCRLWSSGFIWFHSTSALMGYFCVLGKEHKISKTNMYLKRRIKVIYYRKQVIQCCQSSFATKSQSGITVSCYIFIGRVHCVLK